MAGSICFILKPFIMIVNSYREDLFCFILADDVFIKKLLHFHRLLHGELEGGGCFFVPHHEFLVDNFTGMLYAILTNMSFLSCYQDLHLVPASSAERTV